MLRILYLTLISFITLHAGQAVASDLPALLAKPRILPVDQAFRVAAIREDGVVELQWQLQPGYYLYRHSLDFRIAGHAVEQVAIPAGEKARDEFFGDVEIYREQLVVRLGVAGKSDVLDLEVRFQGCADAGYCYPPAKKRLTAAIL
ncbi:MAG: protein-disulfide reductase DsbD domain-containing protein [Pseudomonadota bacterium]